MKKAVIALVALFLAIFTVSSYAVKIDGNYNNDGPDYWADEEKAKEQILIQASSKDVIDFATVKCIVNKEANTVYYVFVAENSIGLVLNLHGFSKELKYITEPGNNDVPALTDTEDCSDYYYNLAVKSTNPKNPTLICEIEIRYKTIDVLSALDGKVQFISNKKNQDDMNIYTVRYSFGFDSSLYTTTVTEKTTEAEKTTKKKAGSTTKANTTKREISTSRVQTTAKTHTTKAAKTSAAEVSTTAEKVKTTKAPKTTAHKVKTTKSRKTTAQAEAETSAPVTVIYAVTESSDEMQTQAETTAPSAFDLKNLPRSTLMKIAAGAGALILFGAIGIAAVRSGNSDKKDEEDNTDKTGEDK